jgi:hypothetical protein
LIGSKLDPASIKPFSSAWHALVREGKALGQNHKCCPKKHLLLDALGLELNHLTRFGLDMHLDGVAAYLAVLDVSLLPDAQIQDEANLLPAVGAKEKVFISHRR